MGKKLIITEKPSVARDFARVLNVNNKRNGYIENDEYVITWCVGHLVEMVYPEKYDARFKVWKLEDLPFLPREYKYDVIQNVKSQYDIVHGFLNSDSIDTVYWAGDSGKEGQTIEENIRNFGGVRSGMNELRVWIDSQTDDEIRMGIKQAKPMSEYANLGKSGIMRAIEDYALGINFSRALSVKYARMINNAATTKKYTAIAVGRVMTCVLGMVVDREREIRNFVETPFYRVIGAFTQDRINAEWHVCSTSVYFDSPALYKENGFKNEIDAKRLIDRLEGKTAEVLSVEKSKSKKKAPPLFNLAELQAECSKRFKISPDETLAAAQALYEKKLTTYPRSDARVLTTAVAGEIYKNIGGLRNYAPVAEFAKRIMDEKLYAGIAKSQYTDDSKVTDHYAIIPTGQLSALNSLSDIQKRVFELIARRFLSIFYPPAEYLQLKMSVDVDHELFTAATKALTQAGYLEIAGMGKQEDTKNEDEDSDIKEANIEVLSKIKKGDILPVLGYEIKQGKTSPPKRYTSGTMVLAMENAGKLIEDEELRAQIKNTGIGTSATRAEIIKKLINIAYLNLNNKTQVLTPSVLGEMIYEVVKLTAPSLLNPQMSASWEKGLDEITNGIVRVEEYREKLEDYIRQVTLSIAQKDVSVEIANALESMVKEDGDIRMPKRNLGLACPCCGGELTTTSFGYGCSNYSNEENPCRFSVGKIAGLRLKEDDFKELVNNGKTGKISGFKGKSGKTFDAVLVLEKDDTGMYRVAFDFGRDNKSRDEMLCPICGSALVKTPEGYACSKYRAESAQKCIFSVGTVFGRILSQQEVRELVTNGYTAVINGFVGKDGIEFSARVALKTDENRNITGLRVIRE